MPAIVYRRDATFRKVLIDCASYWRLLLWYPNEFFTRREPNWVLFPISRTSQPLWGKGLPTQASAGVTQIVTMESDGHDTPALRGTLSALAPTRSAPCPPIFRDDTPPTFCLLRTLHTCFEPNGPTLFALLMTDPP